MLNPFDDGMMAAACEQLATALEARGISFAATARELRREAKYFRDRRSSRSTQRMFAVDAEILENREDTSNDRKKERP